MRGMRGTLPASAVRAGALARPPATSRKRTRGEAQEWLNRAVSKFETSRNRHLAADAAKRHRQR